jgi:hypothetical protein
MSFGSNRLKILFLLGALLIFISLIFLNSCADVTFKGNLEPIPPAIAKKMINSSWRSGCPVPLADLSYLRLSFWGFDGKVHKGELVVHKKLAPEVVEIFKELFDNRFPIERMKLIDEYAHDDNKSMDANNTSAFNCRTRTANPDEFSNHSYGVAIDINPLCNPFIDKARGILEPKAAAAYLDRTKKLKGMIIKGDACYNAFIKRGWTWGGNWKDQIDYQHFEKNILN